MTPDTDAIPDQNAERPASRPRLRQSLLNKALIENALIEKAILPPPQDERPPLDESQIGAFTVAEFCTAHRICRTTFYEEVKSGRLRAVKVKTKTLVLKPDAARWARSLPALKTGKAAA